MAYITVSYLALLPEKLLHPGIWACWTFRGFNFSLGYPLILIILKEVTPLPSFRGKINGLAAPWAPQVGLSLHGWEATRTEWLLVLGSLNWHGELAASSRLSG